MIESSFIHPAVALEPAGDFIGLHQDDARKAPPGY
jgi:hypothetical protein